ncbi:MAG: DUF4845 domain-containing protein [bacterium]|nr:DUF4845 domain-containing protein [bacterium]
MKSIARKAAGITILVALAATVVLLAPAYYRNLQLEGSLERLVAQEDVGQRSDDELRAAIASQARALGIPIDTTQVRVDRALGPLRIEVRYIVQVDLEIYTVDLHFRAGSGAR